MTPGTMISTTWTQVDATSLTDFSRVLTDNITGSQIILWLLGQMGGIVTRQGKTIGEPIMLDDAASAKWYSRFDPLDMTKSDAATLAEYAFKQLAATHQIDGLSQFQNGGPGQIIDLWDALGQQVAITMKKKVNVAIPADGSADGGKALIGLQTAVPFDPTNDTYGTVPSASNAFWRNFFNIGAAPLVEFALSGAALSGPNVADALLGVANLFNGLRAGNTVCTAGGDSLDVVLMTQKLWLTLLEGLESKERIVREVTSQDMAMANAGFKNVVYMGTPHTWDEDMLPNTNAVGTATTGQGCVGLNLDYAKLVFGTGYEFVFSDPIEPTNQDAIVMKCLAYLNMVFSNRRRHFRINFNFTPA